MSLSPLPTRQVLTLEWARALGDAALDAALDRKLDIIVIAIADESGRLMYLLRQDHAEPAAVDIGIAKARTAAIFMKPTKHWKELLLEGKLWVLGMPNMAPIEGGQPIVVNGYTVGGLGIAGASGAVDTEIGTTALAAVL